MAELTTKRRDNLAPSQFALSGDRYPINDLPHARNALARAAQEHNAGNLSDSEYATVKRKAENFITAHEGHSAHADSVKS